MTINCKGQLIDLQTPKVMGIINVTPDSFYDGGTTLDIDSILHQARTMLEEGATFLDVGGYSSRPGADDVPPTEELERVLPAIRAILNNIPEALISVDTFRAEVARVCVEAGAAMINDISGGQADPLMLQTVAELQIPYVMMHSRGNPRNMQSLTQYQQVTRDVLFFFSKQIAEARQLGINDIIADPGFGFAKTLEQNYELLSELELFNSLKVPVLVGLSRKSMINKVIGTSPEGALNGSTVLHTICLMKGANILRVHDVKEAVECIKLTARINMRENGIF
ncbi:dihydropteroate synthase [Aureitalea marina]|uniref:Dihydropteroate synthase n=1 Tax=Aureitalea marina TaxID=930804 RepID=A0A2S7KMC9_9FLAO|nr:dihydropteroate synthase [Aureitalea marina]PQB03789.1 dihydropteroate synthase [Aureitalea marina]